MKNFSTRPDTATWTPISDPPANGERVIVTHADDAFKTETTGSFIDGEWQCACAFMTAGGRVLTFAPTHWRPMDKQESA